MIERISTDLPVPEPPTTPMISPRLTSRSRLSWMTWSPKLFLSPFDLDREVAAIALVPFEYGLVLGMIVLRQGLDLGQGLVRGHVSPNRSW